MQICTILLVEILALGGGQSQAARVGGMALVPSGVGTTPSTWCTEIPPSVKPITDPAMYSRQIRAVATSAAATASSQFASRLRTHARSVRA